MLAALSPSTRSSYTTGWATFSTFCAQNRISPTPFNENWIIAFIVHAQDTLHLSPTSIKTYISWIQFYFRSMSIPSPTLLSIPAVRLTLQGITESLHPASSSRLPMTTVILNTLISILRSGCFNPFFDITGWATFSTFCAQNRISPTPFNENWIIAFIVHAQDTLHLSPTSIKTYISWIQFYFRSMSIPSPTLLSIPAVRLTLQGITESLHPASSSRLPMTTVILNTLISILRSGCFNPFFDIVMEAMCLPAFFGVLRSSEFTVPSSSSFPVIGIHSCDLSPVPDLHYILFLSASKTDQLPQGQFIQISKIDSLLCPFSSLS
ncbi:UNVERIFIED_CONTAM: hypothetical protein FKN15_064170 [Acipenser sinensis]